MLSQSRIVVNQNVPLTHVSLRVKDLETQPDLGKENYQLNAFQKGNHYVQSPLPAGEVTEQFTVTKTLCENLDTPAAFRFVLS
jgi:hypothetical protein